MTLVVPAAAADGTYPSTTSPLTGDLSGSMVGTAGATADLEVSFFDFMKEFGGAAAAGGTVTLTFTLTNPDPANNAGDITFTDDLEAVLPGLTAIGLPANNVCGAGSTLTGTSVLTLTGGNLEAGETCAFSVTLMIPATAADGDFTNVTSPLGATVGGSAVTGDATSGAMADLSSSSNALDIPALSGWGLLALTGLLGTLGYRRLRRR